MAAQHASIVVILGMAVTPALAGPGVADGAFVTAKPADWPCGMVDGKIATRFYYVKRTRCVIPSELGIGGVVGCTARIATYMGGKWWDYARYDYDDAGRLVTASSTMTPRPVHYDWSEPTPTNDDNAFEWHGHDMSDLGGGYVLHTDPRWRPIRNEPVSPDPDHGSELVWKGDRLVVIRFLDHDPAHVQTKQILYDCSKLPRDHAAGNAGGELGIPTSAFDAEYERAIHH